MIRNKSTEQSPTEKYERDLPVQSGIDRNLEGDLHCKIKHFAGQHLR